MREIDALREMLTGKKVDGKKPTIGELEEILAHRDIQLLPDGSITSIKITKTEQAALSSAIKLMKEKEQGILVRKPTEGEIENIIWGSDLLKTKGGAGFVDVKLLAQAIIDKLEQ